MKKMEREAKVFQYSVNLRVFKLDQFQTAGGESRAAAFGGGGGGDGGSGGNVWLGGEHNLTNAGTPFVTSSNRVSTVHIGTYHAKNIECRSSISPKYYDENSKNQYAS